MLEFVAQPESRVVGRLVPFRRFFVSVLIIVGLLGAAPGSVLYVPVVGPSSENDPKPAGEGECKTEIVLHSRHSERHVSQQRRPVQTGVVHHHSSSDARIAKLHAHLTCPACRHDFRDGDGGPLRC